MVETITPAGCGGRSRQALALIMFGLSAILVAAGMGATMGAIGMLLGARAAALIGGATAVLVVLVAASRRLALPQRRAQVPERWRRERPLAAWSNGYGAILGSGILTHQPLGGGWVALCAAFAVADPLAGGLVGAAAGLGRLVMVLPALNADPRTAAAALISSAGTARAAVVAVVAAAGALLSVSPALPAVSPIAALDVSGSGQARAYTQLTDGRSDVMIEVPGLPEIVLPDAAQPSMDGPRVAVQNAAGVRVIDWTTRADITSVPGATSPALAWPHLAYQVRERRGVMLVVRDLVTGTERVLDRRATPDRIGRPVLRRGVVVWHASTGRRSVLMGAAARGGPSRLLYSSRVVGLRTPALGHAKVAWVEDGATCSSIWIAPAAGGAPSLVASRPVREGRYWNLDLTRGAVSTTIWDERTGEVWIDAFSLSVGPLAGCLTAARSPLRQPRAVLPRLPGS